MNLGRRILEGIAFGFGFSAVGLFLYTVWWIWLLPGVLNTYSDKYLEDAGIVREVRPSANREVTQEVPPIRDGFLGSNAIYSSEFDHENFKILGDGPGELTGRVLSNGSPVEGLRLRFGLNGSLMTPWLVTDVDGLYTASVPYGDYRVDAYEIGSRSAASVLAGKLTVRDFGITEHRLSVAAEEPGVGPTLRFADPIVKTAPSGEIASGEAVVLRWDPYPGSASYRVELFSIGTPYEFRTVKRIAGYRHGLPAVSEPMLDLSANGVSLEPGHYRFSVMAIDDDRVTISITDEEWAQPDFAIVD